MVFALVRPFLELCIFRIGPQKLPASTTLFGLALAAYFVVEFVDFNSVLPVGHAFFAAIVNALLLCGLSSMALFMQQRRERIVQTLTALVGATALLDFVHLPVDIDTSPGLFTLLILGWSIAVQGHILRHALAVPLFMGVVLALFFYWISLNVLLSMFAFQITTDTPV